MTDHRATDLVHGHFGEFSYDINEEQWSFSQDVNRGRFGSLLQLNAYSLMCAVHRFQQLLSSTQCIPPSIRDIPGNGKVGSKIARAQQKWLAKKRPETFPGGSLATHLSKDASDATLNRSKASTLMAIGGAADINHTSGSKIAFIVAIPCGEAGHILKLVKPRPEKLGWESHNGVRLSYMSAANTDQGHWFGAGGTILQIASADDGNELSAWFAVRQAAMTTIFRPVFRKFPKPFTAPAGHIAAYPPSCLDPNPVATLTCQQSGSEEHVDVSFNPWYARQFAVVDRAGKWSSWDIEGRQKKRSAFEIMPGKKGYIYDDFGEDPAIPTYKLPGNVGDWHRVLWAGSVSTMIVANRKHLAVFDTKSKPTRLPSYLFNTSLLKDWILDIKRSTVDLSHLFVLTTTRIFWLKVIPTGEDGLNRDSGIKVILSHRHYRTPTDETMKLTMSKDENGTDLTVFISSSENSCLNSYTFFMDGKNARTFEGGFRLSPGISEEKTLKAESISIRSVSYLIPRDSAEGMGLDFMETGVKFHQTWMLTPSLELVSSLWASEILNSQKKWSSRPILLAPMHKIADNTIRMTASRLADDFIVPDEEDEDALVDQMSSLTTQNGQFSSKINKASTDLLLRINMQPVFERIFNKPMSSDSNTDMETAFRDISIQMQNGKQMDSMSLKTCLELSNNASPSGDLDEAAKIVTEFLDFMNTFDEGEEESSSKFHISKLISCPGMTFSEDPSSDDKCPDLLQIYDQLINVWVTNLPRKTPGPVRLEKARSIRRIAMEIWLSSVGISLRNEQFEPRPPPVFEDETSMHILKDIDELSRASSPPYFSSQAQSRAMENPQLSLPTPTPSVISAPAVVQDPTISRLRQYAVSIEPKIEFGAARASLLSQWPSVPGADPNKYSWEEVQRAALAEESGDDDYRSRRENARRKRRAERFLSRDRANAAASSSQAMAQPFGSQPVGYNTYSSQPVNELPMTQPSKGAFGSRIAAPATPGKKKSKKRRAAGF
ncbi:putative rna polymerase i-specific transcription initiation factor rrn6-like protein [Botrytis cinerea BcDW1]|uniref:Putative rna polymerase i-specific transcription initiation factor rrn6-like protein n=1 Tax=Botryotinia fuckeliana (strain BcDW1) TaxID=1290391 RepID=M7TYY9_BOTF1|nr:putative rna polymerase i-specific transcription initiation factor rrn6-like protein [Botrytis cinerea BcDW1]